MSRAIPTGNAYLTRPLSDIALQGPINSGALYTKESEDAGTIFYKGFDNREYRITFDPKQYKYTYKPDTAVAIGDWADDSEQTITIGLDLDYVANDRIEISYDHDNYWIAEVDSYDATTGEIVFTVTEGVADGTDSYSVFTFDLYNPTVRNENVLAVKVIRSNYTALSTGTLPFTPADGDWALVTNPEGDEYTPGWMSGDWYPAGLYNYNGADDVWEYIGEDIAEGVYTAVENQPPIQTLRGVGVTVIPGGLVYNETDGSEALYYNSGTTDKTNVTTSTDFTATGWTEIEIGGSGGSGFDTTANYSVSGNWTFAGSTGTSFSTSPQVVGTGARNWEIFNSTSAPTDGTNIGGLIWNAYDENNTKREYGSIKVEATDTDSSNSDRKAKMTFNAQGARNDAMVIDSDAVKFNDSVYIYDNIYLDDGTKPLPTEAMFDSVQDGDAIVYNGANSNFEFRAITAIFQITYVGGTLQDLYDTSTVKWTQDKIAVIDSGLYLYIAEDQASPGVTEAGDWQLLTTTEFGTSGGTVAVWAEGNNTTLIPAAKLASTTSPNQNDVLVYKSTGVVWESLAEAHLPEGLADWSEKLNSDGVIDADFDFTKDSPVFTIFDTLSTLTDASKTSGIEFKASSDGTDTSAVYGKVLGFIRDDLNTAPKGGIAIQGNDGSANTDLVLFSDQQADFKVPIVPQAYTNANLPTLGSTDTGALAWDATNTEIRYWDGDSWEQLSGGGGASLSTANTWTALQTFNAGVKVGNTTIGSFANARTAQTNGDELDVSDAVTRDIKRYAVSFVEDEFYADQTALTSDTGIYLGEYYTNYRDDDAEATVTDGTSPVFIQEVRYRDDDTNYWGEWSLSGKEGSRADGTVDTNYTEIVKAWKDNFNVLTEAEFSNTVTLNRTNAGLLDIKGDSATRTAVTSRIQGMRQDTVTWAIEGYQVSSSDNTDGRLIIKGRGNGGTREVLRYDPAKNDLTDSSDAPDAIIEIRADDKDVSSLVIDGNGMGMEANTDNKFFFFDPSSDGVDNNAELGYLNAHHLHFQQGTGDSTEVPTISVLNTNSSTNDKVLLNITTDGRHGSDYDNEFCKLEAVGRGVDGTNRRGEWRFSVADNKTTSEETLGDGDIKMIVKRDETVTMYNDSLEEKVLAEGAYSNVISAGSITGSDTVTVSSVDYSVIQYKIGTRHYYRAFGFGTPDETIVVYDGDETEADDTVPTDLLASGKYITTDTKNY